MEYTLTRSLVTAESRAKEALAKYDLTLPIWLFDPDDAAFPRKIVDIPPESHRARLYGWCLWYAEYSMQLERPQESLNTDHNREPRSIPNAATVIDYFRYNPDSEVGDFTAVLAELVKVTAPASAPLSKNKKGRGANASGEVPRETMNRVETGIPLTLFLDRTKDAASSEAKKLMANLSRIQRAWDGVLIWDRDKNFSQHPLSNAPEIIGRAIKVHTLQELCQVSSIGKNNATIELMKVQFEIGDDNDNYHNVAEGDEGRERFGVMWSGRDHDGRGVILGALKSYNSQFLLGSEYEHMLEEVSRDGNKFTRDPKLKHNDAYLQWRYEKH